MTESIESGHDLAAVETIEGLSRDAIEWIMNQMNAGHAMALSEALEAANG